MTTPWHDHPLAHELDVALAAVREAGLLCREVQAAIELLVLSSLDCRQQLSPQGMQAW